MLPYRRPWEEGPGAFVMAEFPCKFQGCDRVFDTEVGRTVHERSHGYQHGQTKAETERRESKGGGQPMEENDIKGLINKAIDERNEKEVEAKREESERTGIAESIAGMGDRFTEQGKKIDDICQQVPWLCATVKKLEDSAPHSVEYGSEEWKAARKRDLEHSLFDDCPECSPIRDEVLKSRGKRLADLEAKVDKELGKVDAEADHDKEKADAERQADDLDIETSPFPRSGFKWDDDKDLYVRQA